MCGRINVSSDPLAELYLELLDQPFPGEDRFNVAPTEQVNVIVRASDGSPGGGSDGGEGRHRRELREMRWWLTPYWSKEPSTRYSMFNAKAETVETSRAYKEPYRRRRCGVPISGFYEWVKLDGRKAPYYMKPASDEGLLLAGIWDRWRGPDQVLESFSILTTAVNDKLAFVHNRQPVMLARDQLDGWLADDADPEHLRSLLTSRLPEPIAAIPVSTYVSNSRNEGARCIEPIGPTVDIDADGDGDGEP